MLELFFIILLLLHGVIHAIGVAKATGWGDFKEVTLSISKKEGFYWGLAGLFFLITAIVLFVGYNFWWIFAALSAVLSQILIIRHWQDAKYGTIANVIILIGCLLGYGSWSFQQMVSQEINNLKAEVQKTETAAVSAQAIDNLPNPVRRWLDQSTMSNRKVVNFVQLTQRGRLKTSPDGEWMPVQADQYVSTLEPGFIWVADVQAAPYIHLSGRDKYEDGRGHMLIKLLSLVPVADAKGQKIDQGTLVRYLAEMIWYPSAALRDYISWEPVNETSARATMSYRDISASGIFQVNQDGEVIRFEAERYYDRKEGATLETWVVDIDADSYKIFDGRRVPTKAKVTWKLDEGDFTWYELEVTDLTVNHWVE